LISAIEYLKKEREENKSSKKELMKQKESVQGSEKAQQVIKNLRTWLEEAKRIEETLEYKKQCLEANIIAQKEEAEKREKILTYHLKERIDDLNQLEEEFGQEERRLEEEIITLKIQLQETKRTEEVMKSQIMKKEEEVEKLEKEVVTLRVKVVKLNKNFEETETSTSVIDNEEKHSRFLEKKNEENKKSYVEVLKGRNHGQPKSKKTIKDMSSRKPFMFKPQKDSIVIMIGQGINSEGLCHKEDHSLPSMQISFMVIVFIILILDIRLQIAWIIKEMFNQEVHMWPHVTLNVTNVITMDT
jgi:chromosome segregation ATPase